MSNPTARNGYVKPESATLDIQTILTDLPANFEKLDMSNAYCNWSGARAPGATDDAANTGGYGVFAIGSFWLYGTTYYICESALVNSAVWVQIWPPKTVDLSGTITNAQLAGSITNDKLAGSITQDKLAGGILANQLAGSILNSQLAAANGWVATGTATFVSGASPVSVLTLVGDQTLVIPVGSWFHVTQSTEKYFIVTAISYGAPNTTVTLWSPYHVLVTPGTAITNPSFSLADSPVAIYGTAGPTQFSSLVNDGWTPFPDMTYHGVTDTVNMTTVHTYTYVIYYTGDVTGMVPVGARIKFYQGATKYGIVTAHTAGVLTVLLAAGSAAATGAITLPYFSREKAPVGFPLSPLSWSIFITDATGLSQNTPTQNTWYNNTYMNIALPIGIWDVQVRGILGIYKIATGGGHVYATLSTANNSESDVTTTTGISLSITTSNPYVVDYNEIFINTTLALAAAATYYTNIRTADAAADGIYMNATPSTFGRIVAQCMYL